MVVSSPKGFDGVCSIPQLMHACAESKVQGADKGQLLAESCVVSSAFLEGLKQRSLAQARAAAEEALKQRTISSASAATSNTEPGNCMCQSLLVNVCFFKDRPLQ